MIINMDVTGSENPIEEEHIIEEDDVNDGVIDFNDEVLKRMCSSYKRRGTRDQRGQSDLLNDMRIMSRDRRAYVV